MTIVIDGGKGLARGTHVRWALEEVGEPYEGRLVSFRARKEPAHLAPTPFGQIPTYEEGDLAPFETGSTRPAHKRAFAAQLAINAASKSYRARTARPVISKQATLRRPA